MRARFVLMMALMLLAGILIGVVARRQEPPPRAPASALSAVDSMPSRAGPPSPAREEPAPGSMLSLQREARETAAGDPEAISDRIASLKELINREIVQRRRLETRIATLRDQVARLEQGLGKNSQPPLEEKADQNRPRESAGDPEKSSEARFLAAGFDAGLAARLKRRENELEMERLYLRDQARREGWLRTPEYREALRDLRRGLREELGEDTYDRFLFAMDRHNRLIVDSVIESSPAEQVGLQPGDILFRYDGQRIFSYSELTAATARGQSGESVPVEIQRNGEMLEYRLPRGPLGVRLDRSTVQP